MGYDIAQGTGGASRRNISISKIGDYDPSEVTILETAPLGFDSDALLAIKNKECSPIAGYGIPIYLNHFEHPKAIHINEGGRVTDGLAVSGLYVEFHVGDVVYYIPAYEVEPVMFPIIGTGVEFERGLVEAPHRLKSAGFLAVVINEIWAGGFPLYK